MGKELAPIALFVYNRPEHTQKTVESLLQNQLAIGCDLFIFSDGAKNESSVSEVKKVREYIHSIKGFKTIEIIERDKNWGLANSIISGVSEIINRFGKIIVIEDDLVFSTDFLDYMNQCLDFYEKNKQIFSISGYCAPVSLPEDYSHDVFLYYRINSWGWATWKNRWISVDWKIRDFNQFITDKKAQTSFHRSGEEATIMLLKQMQGDIDSWAIRFNYGCYKNDGLNIYPVKSKVHNTGTDGSGMHVSKTSKFVAKLSDTKVQLVENLEIDQRMVDAYNTLFHKSLYRKTRNWLTLFFARNKKYK